MTEDEKERKILEHEARIENILKHLVDIKEELYKHKCTPIEYAHQL